MSSRRTLIPVLLGLFVASGCNCGSGTHIITAPETYTVVPGSPTVVADQPTVAVGASSVSGPYDLNRPRVCDIYTQNTVRKVDILWVIQNSGSMAPHQVKLAQNFSSFIEHLLTADPPIDFHIGVTTTDTDDPNQSGALHGWTLPDTSGRSHPDCDALGAADPETGGFIACDSNHVCNTAPTADNAQATAQCAFNQMSDVGTEGSSHQRGLYASYLALSRPENIDDGSGAKFIRPDAALYIVYVGSEDDLSCAPVVGNPALFPGSGGTCNTVDPECKCQDDGTLSWGSTAFYQRFLANYKGYGHSDLVAAAAVVSTQHDPVAQAFGDPYQGVGCSAFDNNTGAAVTAYYGQRYVAVAQATGGSATSICSSNFSDALSRLGFAVSGLRRDFKLSRGPDTQTIEVYQAPRDAVECSTDQECATVPEYPTCQAGHCSKSVRVEVTGDSAPNDGAGYIQCQDGVVRNIVEFGQDAIPTAQGTVEVCYDVDAHFNNASCQ
jgi:hypothetical protein